MKKLFPVLLSLLLLLGCFSTESQDVIPIELPPAVELPPPPPPPPPPPEFHFKDYLRATCRVRISGSGGSGVCFKVDDTYVYVLTCRHVVGSRGKGKSASLEFWANGSITGRYTGKVSRVLKADAAVIVIPVDKFKKDEIPLALPISHTAPKTGDVVVSVGCPGLDWQSMWEGHVTGYSGKSFTFVPPPRGGRSGSGIFMNGEIVGVLWGADKRGGFGVSCTDIKELWDLPDEPEDKPPCPHCGE